MNFRSTTLALLSTVALASAEIRGTTTNNLEADRDLSAITPANVGKFKVTIHNIAFQQPMSRFFGAVHSSSIEPLYEFGEKASEELALLAENGDPKPLVDLYRSYKAKNGASMLATGVVTDGALLVGEPRSFTVTTSASSPYVSFAGMAINTNDCFVGAAGILLEDGLELNCLVSMLARKRTMNSVQAFLDLPVPTLTQTMC